MENGAFLGIFALMMGGIGLAILALYIYSLWRIFEKAGEEGWKALIPFYNSWTLFEISGKPGVWSLALIGAMIPFVNLLAGPAYLVLRILALIELAKKFRAGDGFAVGLILLSAVFFPILAFGDYQYDFSGTDRESLDDKIDNIGQDEDNGQGVEEINVKDW